MRVVDESHMTEGEATNLIVNRTNPTETTSTRKMTTVAKTRELEEMIKDGLYTMRGQTEITDKIGIIERLLDVLRLFDTCRVSQRLRDYACFRVDELEEIK